MSQATLGSAPYLNSNLFSGYYLDERVADRDAWDCDEEAKAVFEELQTLWNNEKTLVEGYNEDTLLGSWIDKVLDAIGFDTIQETPLPNSGGFIDRVLFDSPEDRRDAMAMKQDGMLSGTFGRASALLEAKQWGASFSKTFSEQRQYRDASHQVKYYLERTPDSLKWGILTNGRKWRLYGIKDYETQTYYEVDLPELLDSGSVEAFKYFYVFFRPHAFREVSGTSFLDSVWDESETAAQELGEDLQDNVFTALRILGEGFVETNNLRIDPEDEDEREDLKEQSLVLLYRLMFVLYAESRGLISPDEPGKRSEFEENFSLDELRREIHEEVSSGSSFDEFSEFSTSMWGQLEDLFRLVDAGEESLGIPPYNGGLFDRESHEFLAEHEVANRYIAEVVYRLGTTHAEDGDGFVLADYADLDTRHLGTIYEGLLEHEFRIAPEKYAAVTEGSGQVWKPATKVSVAEAIETADKGELYVVNDDGERRVTGAYYTPEYVVRYIVEETLGPLVQEIDENLNERGLESGTQEYVFRFADEILDLAVLDPAMGSGHFLTNATGYLTERIMERGREVEETAGVLNEQDVRRRVSRECIYGVDINEMAVELAKLSMWLETLAENKPLAFLDHHLKDGNSLVGSDITEVLSEDDSGSQQGQITLFQAVARARQRTLEHVMDRISELLAIDNDEYEDIKSMEELYGEIREDPLYGRLFELANVHTAERFGLDVPGGVYEDMAGAIEDGADWAEVQEKDWFKTAQRVAREENFFHWELEYPEVFFGEAGRKQSDAGFDAVIGNPPYVRIQRIHRELKDYLFEEYEVCASRTDLSLPFMEKAIRLLSTSGNCAYITTSQWLSTDYGEAARRYFASGRIRKVLDFNTLPVFDGVSTYPAVFELVKGKVENLQYGEVTSKDDLNQTGISNVSFRDISYSQLGDGSWVFDKLDLRATLSGATTINLSDLGHFHIGAITGDDSVFVVTEEKIRQDQLESDLIYPYAHRNKEINRYALVEPEDKLIYPYKNQNGESTLLDESVIKSEYPNIYEHLSEHRSELETRKDSRKLYADGEDWYQFLRPGRFDYIDAEKLLFRGLAKRTYVGWLAQGTVFSGNNCPGFISNDSEYADEYLVALLNSTLISKYLVQISPAKMQDYSRFNAGDLNETPIRSVEFSGDKQTERLAREIFAQYEEGLIENADSSTQKTIVEQVANNPAELSHDLLRLVVPKMTELVTKRSHLNLSLLDHLGKYDEGPTLADIGFSQPPQDAAKSVLKETAEEKPNLRVGSVEVHRVSDSTVEIQLSARYKPDDEDEYETDRWGYTETKPQPALRITDLTPAEVRLIESFVPLAVDEAGGFANFRETATKTNSLIDRLRALTLPLLADVSDDLKGYIKTNERAKDFEDKIQRTDELIDQIVYELYNLTEEEIQVVEG